MKRTEKVIGPASYFSSIEKKYGQPVEHWFGILRAAGNLQHLALVTSRSKVKPNPSAVE